MSEIKDKLDKKESRKIGIQCRWLLKQHDDYVVAHPGGSHMFNSYEYGALISIAGQAEEGKELSLSQKYFVLDCRKKMRKFNSLTKVRF